MKIKKITPEIHAELTRMYTEHPELIFQNHGYEYLPKEVFDSKKEQIDRLCEILKEHVVGFSSFNNFRMSDRFGMEIRLQFNYGAAEGNAYFIGVGYLPIDHLRDGFPVDTSKLTEEEIREIQNES